MSFRRSVTRPSIMIGGIATSPVHPLNIRRLRCVRAPRPRTCRQAPIGTAEDVELRSPPFSLSVMFDNRPESGATDTRIAMRTHQSTAALAYRLWVERGCPEGTDAEDWLEAERQLAAQSGPDRLEPETKDGMAPSRMAGARRITPVTTRRSTPGRSNKGSEQPPVDETDDAPASAPSDIGEG
jgi:hypothetical protein